MRFLPIRIQAIIWAYYALWRYGKTSHYRIEAIRGLRATARIPLKDAKTHIDKVLE